MLHNLVISIRMDFYGVCNNGYCGRLIYNLNLHNKKLGIMEKKATLQEFNRFLNIHQQLYFQTLELLKDIPDNVFDNTPIDNDVMYLGERVNKINIAGLIRHFVLAEIHRFQAMK